VDGVVYALDEFPQLDKNYKHTIEIVVDRIVNDTDSRSRLRKCEGGARLADTNYWVHHADAPEGSERDTVFS